MTIPAVDLQPVVPTRGDKVKVILGDEDKDQSGHLLSIDSQVLYKIHQSLNTREMGGGPFFFYLLSTVLIFSNLVQRKC